MTKTNSTQIAKSYKEVNSNCYWQERIITA